MGSPAGSNDDHQGRLCNLKNVEGSQVRIFASSVFFLSAVNYCQYWYLLFFVQPNKFIECFCVVRCRPSPVWAFRDQMLNHMVVTHGMAWLAQDQPAPPAQPGQPAQRPLTPRVARERTVSSSSGHSTGGARGSSATP